MDYDGGTMDTNDLSDKNNTSEESHLNEPSNAQKIQDKFDEISNLVDQLSQTLQEIGGWSQSTLQLFFMEWLRNVAAAKKILVCQILFILLIILFIFSLCVSIGIVFYSITGHLLIGVASFLIAFSAVLLALFFWQKHLLRFLGFKQTISQVKEGMDVISKATKSFD